MMVDRNLESHCVLIIFVEDCYPSLVGKFKEGRAIKYGVQLHLHCKTRVAGYVASGVDGESRDVSVTGIDCLRPTVCENSATMWYEIIPSMLIIGLVPIIPQVASYYINQLVLGNVSTQTSRDITSRSY